LAPPPTLLPSALHGPDHLIVDESVEDQAVATFDVPLNSLDNLPIACPPDNAIGAMRTAFDRLATLLLPEAAVACLPTLQHALTVLENTLHATPAGTEAAAAVATIRAVLDDLRKQSLLGPAQDALNALRRALRELENIPTAEEAQVTLPRIRDLIAKPRPLAALYEAGIDRAKLRGVAKALGAAIRRNKPNLGGKMKDAAIIAAVDAAEVGDYGTLRQAVALVTAILAEVDQWRDTFANIRVSNGAVRIGKQRKRIALAPLETLPVPHMADICRLIAEPKPLAELHAANDLDLRLSYVRGQIADAIAAAKPDTDQHLRQADALLAAMIPEIVERRAVFNGIVVRDGIAEISKLRRPLLGKDRSLLLLDGTGNFERNCDIFRTDRLHHVHAPVPRTAHITGTRNRGYSAVSFTAKTRAGKVLDHRSVEAGKLRAETHQILSRLPAGATLVVATKRVEEVLVHSRVIGDDTMHTHFGALRGKNYWENCRAAMIIGAENVPIAALEHKARAYMVKDWRPFVSMDYPQPDDWPRRQWPYVCTRMRRMADGSRSPVEVEVHPDPRAQSVYEQTREAEAVQALDRVRPVLHHRQIVLMNDLCLDADYDRILRHSELVAGGDRLDQAFLATGFVPRTPRWLHLAHRAIFPTEASAEHALRNYRQFSIRWANWKTAVVFFRTFGQRGPASEAAIDPSRHLDLRATVEAVTGPLEEFQEVAPRRGRETPAAEPTPYPRSARSRSEPRQPGSGAAPPSNMVHGPPDG
jgi:hypothetical protein